MKTKIMALLALTATMALAAPPISMTIGTSSMVLVPRVPIGDAIQWTNGIAWPQGQVMKNADVFYMAQTSIVTSAAAPVHSQGVVGGVRQVSPRSRKLLVVQNMSTNLVYLSVDSTAVVGAGLLLPANTSFTFPECLNSVSAIANVNGSAVGVLEIQD